MRRHAIPAFLYFVLTVCAPLTAQQAGQTHGGFPAVPAALEHTLASGRLLMHASRLLEEAARTQQQGGGVTTQAAASPMLMVAVYMQNAPTNAQLAELARAGAVCMPGTWTPPMDNHPRGFFLASLPADRLNDVLAVGSVHSLGSAMGANHPMNNTAARMIRANAAWSAGWTGYGVKVGVLDSGIDTTLLGTELPRCLTRKDYSLYPQLDDDVMNRITAHGTHVAATAVGRGGYSDLNTGNGGGAYKGMAPEACLAFLKIGNDSSASASDAAIIAALHDAVTLYGARVINLSYGGWSAYHDGSEAVEQQSDWCYAQGVPLFFAAGNAATASRHAMGTVPAHGESGFIEVRASGITAGQSHLSLNLVWYDGPAEQRPLTIRYFDANKNEITAVNRAPMTESPRGTQSLYTSLQDFLPAGGSTWYVKIANASATAQEYHLYEDWFENSWRTSGSIVFANGSAQCTVGSPSTADHVMSVAAWVSRSDYISALGQRRQYGQAVDKLATFSSRGPRIDGRMKPDIAAPGSALISVRDTDVIRTVDNSCVDDDGLPGGGAHYSVMQGTSMAAPVATGAAALILSKYHFLTPQQVYDSLTMHALKDVYTGALPNADWGAGKLDVGFLANLPVSTVPGWVDVSRSGWNAGRIGDVAVTPAGDVLATAGDPWNNAPTTLYRSTDRGASWSALTTRNGLLSVTVAADNTFFAAQRVGGVVMRSTDAGATWTDLGSAHDFTALALCAHDSLLVAPTDGQGVFASSDRGASWNPMNTGLPADAAVPLLTGGKEGWIFAAVMRNSVLRMHRMHRGENAWLPAENGLDTTKHITGLAVTPGGTVFATVWDRVYRSTDNGASWAQAAILNDDLQSVCALSDNTILAGTVSAGVYRSTDGGASWRSFSEGLTTLNVGSMRIATNGYAYAAGAPGSVHRRSLGGTLAAPNLVAPADTALGVPLPAALRWSTVSSALGYTVELSTSPTFTPVSNLVENVPAVEWPLVGLKPLTRYWWRARAVSNAGAGPWSSVRSFTTAPLPPPPTVQTEPANGATEVPVPVTLRWTPAQTATSYQVQIARDTIFTATVLDQAGVTRTSLDVGALQDSTSYTWRIRAVNSGGASAWSGPWSFTTQRPAPPVPVALSPADGAVMVSVAPRLSWSAVSGAGSYDVQVAEDTTFAMISDSSTTTSIDISGLKHDTRHVWRIRSTAGMLRSAWSAPLHFTTTLAAPLLIAPPDNAQDVASPLALEWNGTAGATMYRVELSRMPGMSAPLLDTTGVAGTRLPLPPLAEGVRHYWRVSGANTDGSGEASVVRSFVTAASTAVRTPAAPAAYFGATYPNPAADALSFAFVRAHSGYVRVVLHDLLGRTVREVYSGDAAAGRTDVVADVHALAPAVYILRMISAGTVAEKRFVIRR